MSESVQYMTCGFGELKFADDGSGAAAARKFGGHGAVFKNVDSYGDVIDPGAFSAWLSDVKAGKQEWPAMLSQHGGFGLTAQDMTPIGSWLNLSEDGHGLAVEGELADTPRGQEIYQLMKMKPRPAMRGLSIGYVAKEWEERTKPNDPRRRLKRIDVMEISPVTFPANLKAKVTNVKSIEEMNLVDIEDLLRGGGLSKTQATALVARIKSIGPGNPAGAEGKGGPGNPVAEVAEMLKRNTALMRTA